MKNLRKKFELFCFKNRDKGIPNLMLYIVIGTAVVYLFSQMSGNALLYSTLRFDRTSILQGQVWRLITYPLTYSAGNILLTAITLLCYYFPGQSHGKCVGHPAVQPVLPHRRGDDGHLLHDLRRSGQRHLSEPESVPQLCHAVP